MVPYITAYSGELETYTTPLPVRLAISSKGITATYKDEKPEDRDAYGVLWQRAPTLPPGERGVPRFAKVHPSRQRHACENMLCQVCGKPADRDVFGRVLWLLPENDFTHRKHGWVRTGNPPICSVHAPIARVACPHLATRGARLVWAGRVLRWGYYGIDIAQPDDSPDRFTNIALASPRLSTLLAGQALLLLGSLEEVTNPT